VTYYIRYCPEDDSYLEGMDCSNQGDCKHSHGHGDCVTSAQPGAAHPEQCLEAVEGWAEEGEGKGEGEGEVKEEEWVEDEEREGAVREEWTEEEGEGAVREEWREEEGEGAVREEWTEEEGEEREEWREEEGEGAVREEWTEEEGDMREEWREEEGEVREEWREGDEEAREEWREEGQVMQEQWAGQERHRVEEWAEGEGEVRCEVVEQDPDEQIYNGRPEPILDHHHQPDTLHNHEEEGEAQREVYCPNEEEDEDGDEEERRGGAYTGDYFAPEDNGNSVRVSPYRSRKVVVEGETGEEAEEDIDQIVAEIKMSMSMGSLSSGTDQSPEELLQDPAPSDYPHPKPDAAPYPQAHHRHDSRPKSLNLPSMLHNNPDVQRGIKAHARSPEDRQRWTPEQVSCFSIYSSTV